MHKSNKDFRDRLRMTGFPQWKLADEIGISDSTLCVWLRKPLTGDRLERVQKGLAELERKEG